VGGILKGLFEVQVDSTNRRNHYVATPDGHCFLLEVRVRETGA
jgi:hypothetical protein